MIFSALLKYKSTKGSAIQKYCLIKISINIIHTALIKKYSQYFVVDTSFIEIKFMQI